MNMVMNTHDVYAYGVISSSTLFVLTDTFPAPEGYGEIQETHTMTGGEATNASIVLARLGVRVKLAGNWLGDDDAGHTTKQLLTSYGIDTSRLVLRHGEQSVKELIFSDQHTRTIFGTYCQLLRDATWDAPREEDVASANVACIDPFFKAESILAAELAHRYHRSVVTTDCPYDHEIVKAASVIILGRPFLEEQYGQIDIDKIFRCYQQYTDGLVIFTRGAAPLMYARFRERIKTFQPYHIQPVDTTGSGDAFRAGIVYGVLHQWDDVQTIRFASALAAVVCGQFPGVLKAPDYETVLRFMEESET